LTNRSKRTRPVSQIVLGGGAATLLAFIE